MTEIVIRNFIAVHYMMLYKVANTHIHVRVKTKAKQICKSPRSLRSKVKFCSGHTLTLLKSRSLGTQHTRTATTTLSCYESEVI